MPLFSLPPPSGWFQGTQPTVFRCVGSGVFVLQGQLLALGSDCRLFHMAFLVLKTPSQRSALWSPQSSRCQDRCHLTHSFFSDVSQKQRHHVSTSGPWPSVFHVCLFGWFWFGATVPSLFHIRPGQCAYDTTLRQREKTLPSLSGNPKVKLPTHIVASMEGESRSRSLSFPVGLVL